MNVRTAQTYNLTSCKDTIYQERYLSYIVSPLDMLILPCITDKVNSKNEKSANFLKKLFSKKYLKIFKNILDKLFWVRYNEFAIKKGGKKLKLQATAKVQKSGTNVTVNLPKEIRELFGINGGDTVLITAETVGKQIILRKVND